MQSIENKTREYCNHHFDSTRWNDFNFRDDDIIIASVAKSGTTWIQTIVAKVTRIIFTIILLYNYVLV